MDFSILFCVFLLLVTMLGVSKNFGGCAIILFKQKSNTLKSKAGIAMAKGIILAEARTRSSLMPDDIIESPAMPAKVYVAYCRAFMAYVGVKMMNITAHTLPSIIHTMLQVAVGPIWDILIRVMLQARAAMHSMVMMLTLGSFFKQMNTFLIRFKLSVWKFFPTEQKAITRTAPSAFIRAVVHGAKAMSAACSRIFSPVTNMKKVNTDAYKYNGAILFLYFNFFIIFGGLPLGRLVSGSLAFNVSIRHQAAAQARGGARQKSIGNELKESCEQI